MYIGDTCAALLCFDDRGSNASGCSRSAARPAHPCSPASSLPQPVDTPGGKAGSLHRSLQMFTADEDLTGDERWFCPKCKKFRDADKKFDLWKLPPILIVHLKRFHFTRRGTRRKITSPIRFPLTNLDLSSFMVGPTPRGQTPMYDLYGVINHHGGGLASGHYTACALNPAREKWYAFNDSRVREVDEAAVLSSDAYVLFFTRMARTQKLDPSDESKEGVGARVPRGVGHSSRRVGADDGRGDAEVDGGDDDRGVDARNRRHSASGSRRSSAAHRHGYRGEDESASGAGTHAESWRSRRHPSLDAASIGGIEVETADDPRRDPHRRHSRRTDRRDDRASASVGRDRRSSNGTGASGQYEAEPPSRVRSRSREHRGSHHGSRRDGSSRRVAGNHASGGANDDSRPRRAPPNRPPPASANVSSAHSSRHMGL